MPEDEDFDPEDSDDNPDRIEPKFKVGQRVRIADAMPEYRRHKWTGGEAIVVDTSPGDRRSGHRPSYGLMLLGGHIDNIPWLHGNDQFPQVWHWYQEDDLTLVEAEPSP